MDIATIAITAVITLIVTVIGGLAVEYFKKIKPKLEYSVKEAIPIKLDEKMIGANVVYIANPSSNPVKDITVKIKAVGHEVKNGGIKSTKGLEYSVKEEGDCLQITFPFLKYKDYLAITSIVEGRYGIPREPEVTIRSPDSYTLINVGEQSDRSSIFRLSFSGAILPSFVAALVVGFSLGFSDGPASIFARSDQGTNLALAAAVSGLPSVAEKYTSNDGVYYYNQGPYIYSLAKSSDSKEEIRRLRTFLIDVIENNERMSDTSRSALSFFAGKISLLLGEKGEADSWFDKSKSLSNKEFNFLEKMFREESLAKIIAVASAPPPNNSLQTKHP